MRLRMHTKQIILLLSNNGSNNTKGWQQQQKQQEQQQLFQVHRKAVIPVAVAIYRNRNRNRCTGPRQIEAGIEREREMDGWSRMRDCQTAITWLITRLQLPTPSPLPSLLPSRCCCCCPLQVPQAVASCQTAKRHTAKVFIKVATGKAPPRRPRRRATLPISTLLPATAGAGSAPVSDLTVRA